MEKEDRLRRAEQARIVLDSAVWKEAWQLYRDRCLAIIESADSSATEVVMHAKRLLVAGQAAKSHLEALLTDGKIAAEQIKGDKARHTLFGRK